MIPWVVSYGETLTWTRSPLITFILCFFIRPERTPLTVTLLSHSISIVPPPKTLVTVPSNWIKSSLLKAVLSLFISIFIILSLKTFYVKSVIMKFFLMILKPNGCALWHIMWSRLNNHWQIRVVFIYHCNLYHYWHEIMLQKWWKCENTSHPVSKV